MGETRSNLSLLWKHLAEALHGAASLLDPAAEEDRSLASQLENY